MFNPSPTFSAKRQAIFQLMDIICTPSPPGDALDDPAVNVSLKPVKYVNREFCAVLKKLIEQSGVMTVVFPQSSTYSNVGSHHSSPVRACSLNHTFSFTKVQLCCMKELSQFHLFICSYSISSPLQTLR